MKAELKIVKIENFDVITASSGPIETPDQPI